MPDLKTLQFYAQEAERYAATARSYQPSAELNGFLDRLPACAAILELGTGSGNEAAHMLARGFAVSPTDASPELAAEAKRVLSIDVSLMRFDQLAADGQFDGVWANASLLHAPRTELTDALSRIFRALNPGGLLAASFKLGDSEGRDRFGRYYNYVSQERLGAHMRDAGPWSSVVFSSRAGSGYDGVPTQWIWVSAIR